MNVNLIKLVKASSFKKEDKKKILDNFNQLSSGAKLELWDIVLRNLQWKLEIEFSKRLHERIIKGVIKKKDSFDYNQLEKDILLEIFTKAEVETREEEIEDVRRMIKSYNNTKPSPRQIKPKDQSSDNERVKKIENKKPEKHMIKPDQKHPLDVKKTHPNTHSPASHNQRTKKK